MGAGTTVFRIDPVTQQVCSVQCRDSILMVLADSRNRLWIGTKSGMDVIDTVHAARIKLIDARCHQVWISGPRMWQRPPIGRFLPTPGPGSSAWKAQPGTKIEPGPDLELGGNDSPVASDGPNSLWANQEQGVVHIEIQE